jgi:hypothetical protein
MALTFPLLKFGSVYATSNGLVGGDRAICEVSGLPAIDDAIGGDKALDFTFYPQVQELKDVEITITFPLIDSTLGDSIRDVVQAAIGSTFTLDIDCDLGTFAYTAKPKSCTFKPSILPGKWADFEIVVCCT